MMRTIGAVALAIAGAALLATGLPSTLTALRARRAVTSSCDDSLRTLPSGTWVRLGGCGVDMFHASFLENAEAVRSHRLAPLRPARGSANEPSRIALAIPAASASDPSVFRNTPRSDSAVSQIADLGETIGTVWDNLNRPPHRLVEVSGFESGLARDAILIEIRQVGSLRRSAAFVLSGFVAVALAVLLFLSTPAERVPRRSERLARHSPAPDVRWGLVFVLVLVGMVALWRGLLWYFDPMRQTEPAMVALPAPAAPSNEAGKPAAGTLPDPTREELALLESRDLANQLKAADTLLARAATPDLMSAVDAALRRNQAPIVEARLVCLKSRFEGPEILEFLLARFPKERKELAWNLDPDVTCVLNALVRRVPEAPERIRAALMPAIYADNASTRNKVLGAFRTMDVPQIPAMLVAEASTAGTPFQREALAAALAFGAMRHNPALVAGALTDPYTRPLVAHELRTDPHPNAPRIVAKVSAERSFESDYARLAREREGQWHDVSAALLEIVLDASQPEPTRAGAAEQLGQLVEVGPLYDLRALSPTLESGRLKTSVDATIRALEEHQKNGWKPQMRALPKP